MRRQSVPSLALVALVLASAVAATAPAGAAGTASGPTDGSERTYNRTAFLALADAGDGDVIAGGQTGIATGGRPLSTGPNATLLRVGPNGDINWRIDIEGPNATRVVDIAVAEDGDVYFLVSEQSTGPGVYRSDLRLARATGDGDLTWQEPINGTVSFGAGATLAAGDQGVVLAHRQGDHVRMAKYVGPDPVWEQTYGREARPQALHRTDDGFVLVGNAVFDEPWVLRTTESGRELLNETVPGLDAGRVVGATPTDDGGVLLAGQGQIGFGASPPAAWAARVDADGVVQWSRVYTLGDAQVVDVLPHGDGLVIVGQDGAIPSSTGAETVRLVGVGSEGARLFDERVESVPFITAATRAGSELRVASLTGLATLRDTRFVAELATLSVPEAAVVADARLDPDTGLTSNATVYRGQDVQVERPGAAGETYELVRLPGEYDDFEPSAVRRFELDGDGEVVFESATLPDGEYVLRRGDGEFVAVEGGQVTGPADRDAAAFRVESQHFFPVEKNRTFVDVAGGERRVSLSFASERTDYDAYVTVESSRGADPDAAAVRAAFDDVPGFAGVETVDRQPAARVAVGQQARVVANASALGPGLYEVTVAGVDTRDGGAVATTRVVVGNERERPVGVELGDRTLNVTVGGEASTTVTLTNVTDGVAALSMTANRTGDPAVGLRLHTEINGSFGRGGGSASPNSASTSAAEFGGDTPNGTVRVGSLQVVGDSFDLPENASGTNTVTFRVNWVVDENGVPYSVPGSQTVTVHVTPGENENRTGGDGGSTGGSGSGGRGSGGGGSAS